jgi:hypothetical protein
VHDLDNTKCVMPRCESIVHHELIHSNCSTHSEGIESGHDHKLTLCSLSCMETPEQCHKIRFSILLMAHDCRKPFQTRCGDNTDINMKKILKNCVQNIIACYTHTSSSQTIAGMFTETWCQRLQTSGSEFGY